MAVLGSYKSKHTGQEIDNAVDNALNAVPNTRLINGKSLKNDITLNPDDIGAVAKSQGETNKNKVLLTDSSGNVSLVDKVPSVNIPSTGVSVETAMNLELNDGTIVSADDLKNSIDTNVSDISKLQTNVKNAQTAILANATSISDIQTDINNLNTKVSNAENSISTNSTQIGLLKEFTEQFAEYNPTVSATPPFIVTGLYAITVRMYNQYVETLNYSFSMYLTANDDIAWYSPPFNVVYSTTSPHITYYQLMCQNSRVYVVDQSGNQASTTNITIEVTLKLVREM